MYFYSSELLLDGDQYDLEDTSKFSEALWNEELTYLITKSIVNSIESRERLIQWFRNQNTSIPANVEPGDEIAVWDDR